MNIDELKELDSLMKASRYRAFHVTSLIIGGLVLISSRMSWIPLNSRALVNLIMWSFGCLIIALFMLFWARGRVLATIRLKNLIHYDSLEVQDAEITPIRFFDVIPLGYEVGVNLVSGDHLAFGFWTEQPALTLHELLVQAHRLAAAKKQAQSLGPG